MKIWQGYTERHALILLSVFYSLDFATVSGDMNKGFFMFHNNTKKAWLFYVKTFLFQRIKPHNFFHLNICLHEFLMWARLFIESISNKSIKSKMKENTWASSRKEYKKKCDILFWDRFPNLCPGEEILVPQNNQTSTHDNIEKRFWKKCPKKYPAKCEKDKSTSQHTVRVASGNLESSHHNFFPCKGKDFHGYSGAYYIKYIAIRQLYHLFWLFHLDPRLSLNLTIHSILFPLASRCVSGKFRIKDNTKEGFHKLTYCGQHSQINIFADYTNIQIFLKIYRCRPHDFSASFMVFDRGLVSTVNRKADIFELFVLVTNNSVANDSWAPHKVYHQLVYGFLTNANCSRNVYQIQSDKLYRVLVSVPLDTTKHLMIDGPIVYGKVLKQFEGRYRCSTFQCLLKVFWSCYKIQVEIRYTCQEVPRMTSYHLEENNVYLTDLPAPFCAESICVLPIFAKNDSHVNISITNLFYEGPKSYFCRYGGFGTVEKSDQVCRESPVVCENNNRSKNLFPNFYSQESLLHIITFWFNTISKIEVTLSISATKCVDLWGNLCSFKWSLPTYTSKFLLSPPVLVQNESMTGELLIDKCLLLNYYASSPYPDDGCQACLHYSSPVVDGEATVTMKGSFVEHDYFSNITQCSCGCETLQIFHRASVCGHFDQFCSFDHHNRKRCRALGRNNYAKHLLLDGWKSDFFVQGFVSSTKSMHLYNLFAFGYHGRTFDIKISMRHNTWAWVQVQIETKQHSIREEKLSIIPSEFLVIFFLFWCDHSPFLLGGAWSVAHTSIF